MCPFRVSLCSHKYTRVCIFLFSSFPIQKLAYKPFRVKHFMYSKDLFISPHRECSYPIFKKITVLCITCVIVYPGVFALGLMESVGWILFCDESWPLPCRMLSNILSLHPLEARSTPLVRQPKINHPG